MTKSPLSDQAKLKVVCDDLCDNIDSLLEYFNLDYKHHHKMITMSCPIHDGDNPSAINIYPEGDYYRGNWKCRTHGCEKVFKGSILGFVRGVISSQKYEWTKEGDETCSFKESVDFALGFLNKDLKDIKIPLKEREKKQFASVISYLQKNNNTGNDGISREKVVGSLKIPASYYIQRNYSPDILKKYDVGLCDTPGKEMYDRVVVPIYNNEYTKMIGCSGRSIYEKCQNCKGCHDPSVKCMDPEIVWQYSKWKHSKDFKSQNYLYNFWFAKEHILKTHTAIIVESPGNVWRLEENGIHNSVAIFGSSLSDYQKILLDSSGAMNLIVLTDNDEAGHKAAQNIKQKCQNTYRVFIPKISKSDVGEMNSEEINNEIKKYLESIV